MNAIQNIIGWIDRGYDDGARSNYYMGTIISVACLVAINVDSRPVRLLLFSFAAATFLFFGWRMLLYFRRLAQASDRRKRRRG
jgi:hypothetical protein